MMRSVLVTVVCMLGAATADRKIKFTTFADGTPTGGIRQGADIEDGLDSPGDVFVFSQKLWNDDRTVVVGNNAGYCIRTDPGAPDFSSPDHPTLPDDPLERWGECTWTLTFNENSDCTPDSTITVSGREAQDSTSFVAIVGGTGDFVGVYGTLETTPVDFNGLYFEQKLEVFMRGGSSWGKKKWGKMWGKKWGKKKH